MTIRIAVAALLVSCSVGFCFLPGTPQVNRCVPHCVAPLTPQEKCAVVACDQVDTPQVNKCIPFCGV